MSAITSFFFPLYNEEFTSDWRFINFDQVEFGCFAIKSNFMTNIFYSESLCSHCSTACNGTFVFYWLTLSLELIDQFWGHHGWNKNLDFCFFHRVIPNQITNGLYNRLSLLISNDVWSQKSLITSKSFSRDLSLMQQVMSSARLVFFSRKRSFFAQVNQITSEEAQHLIRTTKLIINNIVYLHGWCKLGRIDGHLFQKALHSNYIDLIARKVFSSKLSPVSNSYK